LILPKKSDTNVGLFWNGWSFPGEYSTLSWNPA